MKPKSKPKRWVDWLTIICVFILCLISITRLTITNWADNLELAGWLLLLGVGFGYLIGISRIHWTFSFLLSIILTGIVVPFLFLISLSHEIGLITRFLEVWGRIIRAGNELLANQPVSDSIIFLLAMAVLFWIIGIATGFLLVRNARPWVPLIILGISVFIIQHYQPENRKSSYSWIYLIMMLILLGRIFFIKTREKYIKSGKQISAETEFDFMKGVLFSTLIIILAAWILPGFVRVFIPDSPEQSKFTKKWANISSQFENAFYSLDASTNTIEQSAGVNMTLGTGQILGQEEVLSVETSVQSPSGYPFYWRGKTYDVYDGGVWSVGPVYKQYFKPSQTIQSSSSYSDQVNLKIWITSRIPKLSQVYTTGEVTTFSRAVDAAVTEQTLANQEFLAFFMTPEIRSGDVYRFETTYSTPTYQQLEEAGTRYPAWMMERYLQIPAGIPTRIIELSHALTDKLETPYDKAAAITLYLRQNIEYQATIPAPPRKQDPIDWFLFDYKKGFCNYSATAEVLLLRAAGIPARLAVGYAQGTSLTSGIGYSVQRDDSHAWPEVYFPGIGWIPFEPTGSLPYEDRSIINNTSSQQPPTQSQSGNQAGIDRSAFNGETRAERILDEIGGPSTLQIPARKISVFGWVLIGLLGITGIFLIVFIAIRIIKNWHEINNSIHSNWKLFRQRLFGIPILGLFLSSLRISSTDRGFFLIQSGLITLDQQIMESDTPKEMADRLSELVPEGKSEILTIVAEYQFNKYSRSETPVKLDSKLRRRIQNLILRKWFMLTAQKIRKMIRKKRRSNFQG